MYAQPDKEGEELWFQKLISKDWNLRNTWKWRKNSWNQFWKLCMIMLLCQQADNQNIISLIHYPAVF